MPEILGSRVDNVNMQDSLCLIEQFIREKRMAHIVTLNAEIAYIAQSDEKLQNIINNAALVTPDGTGIVWAAQTLGDPVSERVAGVDLMEQLCKQAAEKGHKVFLLGAEDGVARDAAAALQKKYTGLEVCGTYHGFFLKEETGLAGVITMIEDSGADILFVAMGAPKQEFIIQKMMDYLPSMVIIGVGGSFDVFAGRVKRAPKLIQKMRLEWLWRTVLQPSRWKRTMRLPLFMQAVKRQAKKKK
ncbi:MAG: WecB/TagA/CpsF family glycosyltransferase [Firmicutes bacterium]|nr:WecB/TagA/CpsF family glycosyltransferase [Bacillota bacterium]